jgi:hypothetical protein
MEHVVEETDIAAMNQAGMQFRQRQKERVNMPRL